MNERMGGKDGTMHGIVFPMLAPNIQPGLTIMLPLPCGLVVWAMPIFGTENCQGLVGRRVLGRRVYCKAEARKLSSRKRGLVIGIGAP